MRTEWLWSVFGLALLLSINASALAAPLTVELNGDFTNQRFTINLGGGDHDNITFNATVRLSFCPSIPSCDGVMFSGVTAHVSGSIRVWGSATRHEVGATTTRNFDDTRNYVTQSELSVPIQYEGETGDGDVLDLKWSIPSAVDPNRPTPYRLHFDGNTNRLRIWVALPSPFRYREDIEFYDSAGATIVSGQENVNSCLKGVVLDAEENEPVADAEVRFWNVPRTADGAGAFLYRNIPSNTYQLIVNHEGYHDHDEILTIPPFSIVENDVELTPKVPVILVHGWGGSAAIWDNLIPALEAEEIEFHLVNYWPARGDPRTYSQNVAAAIAECRDNGYMGKVDIVCHSMGALVTRWYIEEMEQGDNVRQWIGLAPVNQGAALADYPGNYLSLLALIASTSVEDLRHDGAITQMRTDSTTVRTLSGLPRWPGVIYRVIVGYNGCAWPSNYVDGVCKSNLSSEYLHPFSTRGKTVARITDDRGIVHPHAWTFFGDGVVAMVQSQLPRGRRGHGAEGVRPNNLIFSPAATLSLRQCSGGRVGFPAIPDVPHADRGPARGPVPRDGLAGVAGRISNRIACTRG